MTMFKDFRMRRGETPSNVVGIDGQRSASQQVAVTPIDSELQAHLELKSKMHEALLERLNLSVIDKVEKSELRRQIAALVTQLLEEDRVPLRSEAFSRLVDELIFEVLGLGPLEPLLADPTVNDILVNSHSSGLRRALRRAREDERPLPGRTAPPADHRQDREPGGTPDRRKPALGRRAARRRQPGQRDHPPLLGRRTGAIDPQVRAAIPYTLDSLVENGTLTAKAARILRGLVEARLNVLISGGTGSGKTTLLNAMSSFIGHSERIVTIEDAAELQLQQEHVVRLETRPPSAEGTGTVSQRDLVRNALRMRPDRIIVGEVRGRRVLRHAPGDEHRPRRVDDHRPRQHGARRARPARADGDDDRR
jgi:pilus assembly protein CpaF